VAFIKRKEDFICEHCGASVVGTGYTNHCPKCLWSKHVDLDPGDRKAECGGMMRPIRVEGGSPKYVIIQKCERCGIERRIHMADNDNGDVLVALANNRSNSS